MAKLLAFRAKRSVVLTSDGLPTSSAETSKPVQGQELIAKKKKQPHADRSESQIA
jgi:hypothetical protein